MTTKTKSTFREHERYTEREYKEAQRLLEEIRMEAAIERAHRRELSKRASSLIEAECLEQGRGRAIATNRENSLTGKAKAVMWNNRMGV